MHQDVLQAKNTPKYNTRRVKSLEGDQGSHQGHKFVVPLQDIFGFIIWVDRVVEVSK